MANKEKETLETMETMETETTMLNDIKLFVKRVVAKDKFGKVIKTKTGEPIFNYQLAIELRGRKTVIDFSSIDKGGFEPLGLVYSNTDTAELKITKQDEIFNNVKRTVTKYELFNIDEDGILWSCGVRPARRSDTDLLEMYLNVLRAKA